MSRPRIGITRKGGAPLKSHQAYRDRISQTGGDPIDVMHPENASDLCERLRLAGLVFSGGGDLNPIRYGEQNVSSHHIDDDRDKFEMGLIRAALAADLPILAICRGFQLLNIACNGKLLQGIGTGCRAHAAAGEASAHHEVELIGDSRLRTLFKNASRLRVNSRHHQAVTRAMVGCPLSVVAVSSDEDIVEAVERRDRRWVTAVQWHPERVQDEIGDSFQPLFDDFVRATADRANPR